MMNPGRTWLKKSSTETEENVTVCMEQSIPMYQCGLCCVKYQSPNELINHVEKGEHFQSWKEGSQTEEPPPKEQTSTGVRSNTEIFEHEEMEMAESGSVIVRSGSSIIRRSSLFHCEDEPVLQRNISHFGEEPENLVKREQQIESSSCESTGIEFSHFEDVDQNRSLEPTSSDGHERRPFYKCIKCPSTFESALELKNHRSAHGLDCPFCGDAFYIKPSLDRHIREKHESEGEISEGPAVTTFASDVLIEPTSDGCYGCKICGKVCAARSDMSKHVRRHTDERPYSCSICSDRFKHRSAITNHMRIHTGEKPYSCIYCSKKFSQPSNKRRHEALHRGERPFGCDMCNRTFSEKTTLQTHMLQHTGERPFVCTDCGKGHITNSALTQHKRSRHQRVSGSDSPVDSVDVEIA